MWTISYKSRHFVDPSLELNNAFVQGRKATVYAWKTDDLLKQTFSMKLTTKEKKKENVPYIFVNNMGIA